MDGKDRIIAELQELNAKLTAQIEQLTARIAELELALAKAKKDSSTSSKPPSSDIVTPKPKQKKPGRRKKRKRGGQPGHQQQLRAPLPPERVDETIDYEIDDGEVRRLGLTPTGDFDVIPRKRPRISLLRGSQWWSISTRNLRRPAGMISRRTTFVSCLPKSSNRRTNTVNSRFATA